VHSINWQKESLNAQQRSEVSEEGMELMMEEEWHT
jgi:hypothetical protein